MLSTCPCCGARFSLEAIINDDAGRELMALLATLDTDVSRPLVAYLGLFRPLKQALSWRRALKIAHEVVALQPPEQLAAALNVTLDSLREKQQQPNWKPLSKHNYLMRVFETVGVQPALAQHTHKPATASSKTGQAIDLLEQRKHARSQQHDS